MVTWVLQKDSNFSSQGTNEKIIARLKETGHSWHEMFIIPFSHEVQGGDPQIDGPVVAYGSTIIDSVVQRNNWTPGVFDYEGVRESVVREALGDLYMNNTMKVLPVREAAEYAGAQGWDFFFAKPNTDTKEFPGTVSDPKKFPFFIEQMLSYDHVQQHFDVCVSPLQQIGIEWRLPVVNGKVVDYSIYRQWRTVMPKREIYDEVLEFAAQCIAIHDPSPAYVIDIGQVGNDLRVIEYNGFNHAGLYECDINNVVDAINEMIDE